MADIKEEMSKIEKAYKGKEIKEAILSALDKVNETNGTARYLDGHPPDAFLSQDELNEILPLDSVPTEGSNKGISSGKIYSYFENLSEAIDDVNVVENTSGGFNETIKEKLEYLNETKQEIRKEIADHGIDIYESTPLSDYQHLIGLIEMEADHEVEPLEVTENKTYEAPEGHAYNPVTVEVPFNLTEKPITKNGKYKAETDGVDGFSAVVVDGSSMLRTKNVSGSAFPEEMETLKYKAKDEGEDVIGYSEIKIDLSDKVDPKKEITLDAEEAGEEYVYEAKDDGVYGYGKFILSIRETKTEFTVQFISEGETVYVEADVPMGGSCSYGGDTLEREGYIFAGWNPQPVNIVRDTKCIAQWEISNEAIDNTKAKISGGTTIDEMNWDEVMAHHDYINEGDSKRLYWSPFEFEGLHILGGSAIATCIGTGNNADRGANSTWKISINLSQLVDNSVYYDNSPNQYITGLVQRGNVLPFLLSNASETGDSYINTKVKVSYTNTVFYNLGQEFANKIKECKGAPYSMQENLNFKTVLKRTRYTDSYQQGVNDGGIESIKMGGLWLFSQSEYTPRDSDPETLMRYPNLGAHPIGVLSRSIQRQTYLAGSDGVPYKDVKAGDVLSDVIRLYGGHYDGVQNHRYLSYYRRPEYWDDLGKIHPESNEYKYHANGLIGYGDLPSLIFGFCL